MPYLEKGRSDKVPSTQRATLQHNTQLAALRLGQATAKELKRLGTTTHVVKRAKAQKAGQEFVNNGLGIEAQVLLTTEKCFHL